MPTMSQVMSEALELPRSDRSYLASKLIESLGSAEDISPEFQAELDARYERWESGKTQAVTSESLHQDIEKILAR